MHKQGVKRKSQCIKDDSTSSRYIYHNCLVDECACDLLYGDFEESHTVNRRSEVFVAAISYKVALIMLRDRSGRLKKFMSMQQIR